MTNNSQARPAAPAKPVERIPPNAPAPDRLRVAAYCRTSTELECQESSISGQRSHYRDRILSRPDWAFAGIYWETGSSLRAESRPELQRLLADCAAGRMDLILTKSLSRFSRSAADCLSMIRALTGLGVAVRFEKENLRTDRLDSKLLLSILAALAEEESRAISDNLKWGIRKRFAAGTYRGGREPYGYRRSGPARLRRSAGRTRSARRGGGADAGGAAHLVPEPEPSGPRGLDRRRHAQRAGRNPSVGLVGRQLPFQGSEGAAKLAAPVSRGATQGIAPCGVGGNHDSGRLRAVPTNK